MYYEVYVDVLFVKNLWMNAMLLLLTGWADQETIKWYKILAAAVTAWVSVSFISHRRGCPGSIMYWDRCSWQQP